MHADVARVKEAGVIKDGRQGVIHARKRHVNDHDQHVVLVKDPYVCGIVKICQGIAKITVPVDFKGDFVHIIAETFVGYFTAYDVRCFPKQGEGKQKGQHIKFVMLQHFLSFEFQI